jgi:hypothetical protein
MAANPALVRGFNNELIPQPFPGEVIALARAGVDLCIDNIQSRSGK